MGIHLMDWDTGEVVAKGTSVELVEQGYFSRCEQAEQCLE